MSCEDVYHYSPGIPEDKYGQHLLKSIFLLSSKSNAKYVEASLAGLKYVIFQLWQKIAQKKIWKLSPFTLT